MNDIKILGLSGSAPGKKPEFEITHVAQEGGAHGAAGKPSEERA